jgi:hypothetical protein
VFPGAGPDTLVFWTWRDRLTPTTDWKPGAARAVVFDEHGCASPLGRLSFRQYLHSSARLEAWEVLAYPRRGKTVGLRLEQRDAAGGWTPITEFTVPNPTSPPSPKDIPAWTPEPLPISKQEGDLAFTLTGLTTGISPGDPASAAAGDRTWTRATFRVSRNGQPGPEWEPVGLTVSDATGNRFEPPALLQRRADGESHLSFLGLLWAEEPTWKLQVRFAPTALLPPEQLWTVRRVSGIARRAAWTVNRQGITLKVGGIADANEVSSGGELTQDTPSVYVQVSPAAAGERLILLRATDAQGRAIPTGHPHPHGPGSYSIGLQLPPGFKSAELTFALPETRTVEFIARPSSP